MNYKVLYRKYRPKNFDDIVGQGNTIELLKDSVINDKISHAYIFSGPRGTGKTSTAKVFAKTINCLDNKNGVPCEKCENCLNFNQSSDIYEIDAASNNGVDQVRELIDNIKLTPINSRFKIYIIDEVHMLSTSAFNALLLTLEEPPSHVVFILATTDIEDVPITVLSRCQRLDFRKISMKDIVSNLKMVAEKENISIDDEALLEIADFSDGGMRDALSILDQLSKTNENITQNIVLESLGSISNKMINDLVKAIEENDAQKIVDFVKITREQSADFKSVCKRIIKALEKVAINIKLGNYDGNLDYNICKNLCFEISSCIYKYNVNLDPYTMLELILLDNVAKFTNDISREINSKSWEITENKPKSEKIDASTSSDDNISQEIISSENSDENTPSENIQEKKNDSKEEESIGIEDIDNSISNGYISELVDVRVNNCFVDANKDYLNEAKGYWEKFIALSKVKKEKGILLDTSIVLASDKIIVIKADLDSITDQINEKILSIEEAFNDYVHGSYKLISVTPDNWTNYMQAFKNNYAKGIKYQYKDEPTLDNVNQVVDDIFVSKKIEIK